MFLDTSKMGSESAPKRADILPINETQGTVIPQAEIAEIVENGAKEVQEAYMRLYAIWCWHIYNLSFYFHKLWNNKYRRGEKRVVSDNYFVIKKLYGKWNVIIVIKI